MTQEGIVNRVAQSSLKSFDLEDFLVGEYFVALDIAPQLENGFLLREKPFRAWVKETDWSVYEDKVVAIHCSLDAIVPTWAYMLVATKLNETAKAYYFGTLAQAKSHYVIESLRKLDLTPFHDAKLVVKGCGELTEECYVEVVRQLGSVASSLMYGEPCSSVPVFKRPKNNEH